MRTVGGLVGCLFFLWGCGPAIHVPQVVARADGGGRTVSACVVYGERGVRRQVEGVAEWNFAPWNYAIATVLVRHPAGVVAIDPAFGRGIAGEASRLALPFKLALGDGRGMKPLVEGMAEANLKPEDVAWALVTHAHWDHVGALGDLPRATVLVSRAELESTRHLGGFFQAGVMPHHLLQAKSRIRAFELSGPPRDGFAASFDVFGDGAIVAVPMPGHTPGSVGYFLRTGEAESVLLIGDATWTSRGVEKPVHKWVPIDADKAVLSESLGVLHALHRHRPDVRIIPAHDGAALGALPECGTEGALSLR